MCTLTGSSGSGTLPATKTLDTTENTNLYATVSPTTISSGNLITATINVVSGVQDSFRGYVGRLVTSQSGDQDCVKITRLSGQTDFTVWGCGLAANNYTVTFCFRGKDGSGIRRMYTAQATVNCAVVSSASAVAAINDNDFSDSATAGLADIADNAGVATSTKVTICGSIVSNLVKKGLSSMTGTSDVAGMVTKSLKSVFTHSASLSDSVRKLAVGLLDSLCSNAEK